MNGAIDGLTAFIIYLAIGGGVYLINYGEPANITLTLLVVMVAWPFALIWWALWWILWSMALVTVVCVIIIGVLMVGEKMGVR